MLDDIFCKSVYGAKCGGSLIGITAIPLQLVFGVVPDITSVSSESY
jgi:hypothetical protein